MVTDGSQPRRAPRPGDPRSPGARPRATWRDRGWALLGLWLVVVTVAQVVGLLVAIGRLEVAPTTLGLVLGFLVTVGWFLTIYWFAMGAWRRSVWGCPFDHATDARFERRCTRHCLLEPTATPPGRTRRQRSGR